MEPITNTKGNDMMSLQKRISRDMHDTWIRKFVAIDNVKDKERLLDIVADMMNDLARKS